MSTVPIEGYADLPEEELLELDPAAPQAPSVGAHLGVLIAMAVFGVPGVYFMLEGETFAGTLLIGIPFVVVSFISPFIGLCYLFAIAPLDSIYQFGLPYFSGSKTVAIPIGLGFLLHLIARPETRVRLPRESKFLIALAGWSILTVFWSPYPKISALGCSSFALLNVLLIMVLGLVRSPRHLTTLLLYVFAGSVVLGVYSLIRPAYISTAQRITLGELNPNDFGHALAFGLFAGLYLAWRSRMFLVKLVCGCGMFALLMTIFATQGRSTFVSLVIALVAAGFVVYRNKPFRVLFILIGIGGVLLLAGLVAYEQGFFGEAAALRRLTDLRGTSGGRLEIWGIGIETGLRRLFVGWGAEMFPVATNTGRDAHSNYVSLFVDLGVLGLALWVTALVLMFVSAVRTPGNANAFLLVTLVTMIAVRGTTGTTLTTKTVWYQIGIILAGSQIFLSRRGLYPPEEPYPLEESAVPLYDE